MVQYIFNRLGSTNRQRRFLDHNFIVFGHLSNLTCTQFNVFQIGSHSFSFSISLGRRIYRNKNQLRFINGFFNICRKKEVSASGSCYNSTQSWFINRNSIYVFIIPSRNTISIQIYYRYLNIWTFLSNYRHGRPSHITCSNTTNFCNLHLFIISRLTFI